MCRSKEITGMYVQDTNERDDVHVEKCVTRDATTRVVALLIQRQNAKTIAASYAGWSDLQYLCTQNGPTFIVACVKQKPGTE